MFKFKGISSDDMQVVIEEEEHFIAKAAQRYETIEIEGKDGADFETSGYSYVERPILVQCLNINKIDDILAWLNGEGEFEYKGRKTIARFYSQLEPQRSACIRIIDTTFIRDPFWSKANDEFEIVKSRKDKKATGEYIELNDSSDMPYEDFKIYGKSEQETREGYNLANLDRESFEYIGLTCTNNGDGSWTINGTTNSSGDIVLTQIRAINSKVYNFQNDTYLLKTIVESGSIEIPETKPLVRIACVGLNGETNDFNIISTNIGLNVFEQTKQLTTDYFLGRIELYIGAEGIVFKNYKIRVLLAKSDDISLEWQPYGAMPSPEFQSPIESVADDINEFNPNEELSNGYKAFYAKESVANSEIGNNIFQHYAQNTRCKAYLRIKAGQTRFFKLFDENYKMLIARYANEEGIVEESLTFLNNNSRACKYTASADGYIYLSLIKVDGSAFTDEEAEKLKNCIKICEKEPMYYSEYGKGTITIANCNRNIGNIDLLFKQMQDFNFNACREEVVDGKNCIVFNNSSFQLPYGFMGLPQRYKENTRYKMKFKARIYNTTLTSRNALYFEFSYTDGSRISSIGKTADGENWIDFELISNANKTINCIGFSYGNSAYWAIDKDSFIIEEYVEGQETEYVPNEEQDVVIQTAPLRSLPNRVYDEKDGNKTIRNIKELALDGTENWGYDTSLKVFYLTSLSSEIKHSKENNDILIMSNYFKGDTANNCIKDDYDNCIGVNTLGSLLLKCNKFNGEINEFKAFLSEKKENGTPVTVFYELAEPEIEEEPCEEIANLHSYKNITNITTEGDIKPTLDVTYIQLTDELILNTGNIESRPIIRLRKTIFDLVELTINNVRFIYHFNNDDYVDIDCKEKTIEYKGINRNRQIEIEYDFPKLNIGSNKIIMHRGDCIIEIKGKDRWL